MKYLALDIGNVLCYIDFSTFLDKLKNVTGIHKYQLWENFNKFQKLQDVGHFSLKDILSLIYNINDCDNNVLIDLWNDTTLRFNLKILKFLSDLQNENVKIALLSNIGIDHANHFINFYNNRIVFSNTIKYFSCNYGLRKPNPIYYMNFLNIYPEFKGCLYLDDLPENIKTGKEFKFNSIRFDLNDYGDNLTAAENFKKIVLENI